MKKLKGQVVSKFMGEVMVKIGKGTVTNENELGVELELKNFKAQLGEIRWS
jgi:hypothetical protein